MYMKVCNQISFLRRLYVIKDECIQCTQNYSKNYHKNNSPFQNSPTFDGLNQETDIALLCHLHSQFRSFIKLRPSSAPRIIHGNLFIQTVILYIRLPGAPLFQSDFDFLTPRTRKECPTFLQPQKVECPVLSLMYENQYLIE